MLARFNNSSWKCRNLKSQDLFHFQLVHLSPDSRCPSPSSSISEIPYSGQNDLVEVRIRQLSYHIGPTLVSSDLSSALLAQDCTKNAGIISFFEPPSAMTLTEGLLLILDHIFTSLYTDPHQPITPCPIYPSHPLFKHKNLDSHCGAGLNSMK